MISSDFDAHERARWSGRAAAYDRSFARLCAHPATALLDAAGATRGTRVLDVGTGTGTVAAQAHRRGAAVVAVDAEPTMLTLAARCLRLPEPTPAGARLRGAGPAVLDLGGGLLGAEPDLPQDSAATMLDLDTGQLHDAGPAPSGRVRDVALVLASLPVLPFAGGTFDAAVANFVINHVGDPAAAVAELARVTRPGGRVALTVWPAPTPTAQRLWGEIFDAAGAVRPPDLPRLAADDDFARTEEGVAALLRSGGLAEAAGTTLTWTVHIAPGHWWAGPAAGIGVPGLVLEHQPPAMVARIRAAFDELTAPYLGADGLLALPTAAVLGTGVVV